MDLEAEKNLARHAARLVRFEGQMNCRDLGGLPTEDGGELATGRIYRSGRLSNLSAADIAAFTALGIRQLFDFRLQFERENYPNPDPASLNLTEHHHGYLPEGAPLYEDMTPSGMLSFVADVRGLSGADRRNGIDNAVDQRLLGADNGQRDLVRDRAPDRCGDR